MREATSGYVSAQEGTTRQANMQSGFRKPDTQVMETLQQSEARANAVMSSSVVDEELGGILHGSHCKSCNFVLIVMAALFALSSANWNPFPVVLDPAVAYFCAWQQTSHSHRPNPTTTEPGLSSCQAIQNLHGANSPPPQQRKKTPKQPACDASSPAASSFERPSWVSVQASSRNPGFV